MLSMALLLTAAVACIPGTRFPSGKRLREWRKNETRTSNIGLSVGKKDVPGGSRNNALVRSSRSGVWGGALAGTVRSLAVVVENRK